MSNGFEIEQKLVKHIIQYTNTTHVDAMSVIYSLRAVSDSADNHIKLVEVFIRGFKSASK